MQPKKNRSSLTVLSLTFLGWLAAIAYTSSGLTAAGTLTGCKIEAELVERGSATLAGQVTSAFFSARYTDPTKSAECNLKPGRVWTWTIKSVERWNSMTMAWDAHAYRPQLIHYDSGRPQGALKPVFPVSGPWRVTLEVKAVWTSEECGSCTATDSLVIDFPDVGDCSFYGLLIPDDDFDGRSWSAVGLREKGKLSAVLATGTVMADVAPLRWRLRSGDQFIESFATDGNGNATFQASFKAGQAVFELESQVTGCVSTLTLDVVAPIGTRHKFSRFHPENGIFEGAVSFHIFNRVYIRPSNVSFSQITFWEGKDPKADMTGEFNRAEIAANNPNAPHLGGDPLEATVPVNAQDGSCWVDEDQVGPLTIQEYGMPGHFIWEIPQQWEEEFEMGQAVYHEFEIMTQRHDFDGKRTIRTQKGGVDKSGP